MSSKSSRSSIDRRTLLCAAAAVPAAALAAPGSPAPAADETPRDVGRDPQLFLDDYLIDSMEGLSRVLQHPEKLPDPVLDSARFGTTQPYLSVIRDGETDLCRMWYNRGSAVWHAESKDGIRWMNPRVAWDLPRAYGCSLVDTLPTGSGGVAEGYDPARRYRLANWQSTRELDDGPKDNGGMYVGFSPDGLRWTLQPGGPALPTYPGGYPTITRHGIGDIVDVYHDPLRRLFGAAVKLHALPEDGYAPAPRAGRVFRRLVGMSTSRDFVRWEEPRRIFAPDEKDEGLLEFYGMGGIHLRGSLRIGLVRVLRDDLPCDPGGPRDGIGYTVLATSRDGIRWQRYREPFLDRSPGRGTWDHAMAWASGVLRRPDGAREELFIYYGGYARGHKVEPQRERQIGLARLRRDRYAALSAGARAGSVRTRPLRLPAGAKRLTVNASAGGGEIRVRLLDSDGRPLPGFGFDDCLPIAADSLAAPARWKRPLAGIRKNTLRIEFRIRDGGLYAFQFEGGS